MITPTIGRVVWFYSGGKTRAQHDEQPEAAIVAYVWNDRMVNLGGFDRSGIPFSRTSVTLVQDGDPEPAHAYCAWMPYQLGQAKRTEAAEAKAAAGVDG